MKGSEFEITCGGIVCGGEFSEVSDDMQHSQEGKGLIIITIKHFSNG